MKTFISQISLTQMFFDLCGCLVWYWLNYYKTWSALFWVNCRPILQYGLLCQTSVVCEKQKRLCYFSPLAVTVSKKLGVQLCVVGCNKTKVAKPVETGTKSSQYTQRSSFQDSYKKTEIWALQDLNLIDGRDPDVVSRWKMMSPRWFHWCHPLQTKSHTMRLFTSEEPEMCHLVNINKTQLILHNYIIHAIVLWCFHTMQLPNVSATYSQRITR